MKKIVLIGISVTILGFAGYVAFMIATTRSHSPKDEVSYELGDLTIEADYYRPYKKGRKVFGGLVPYGEYWRTGANDATEITFSRDVLFGGEPVPKGRYRLYSTPNINEWTIVLNSELGQWGAFLPNHDLDVAKVTVPSRPLGADVEQFTIFADQTAEGINFFIRWEKTEVIVPIQ
jgi:hypothetical protein